MQMGMVAVTFCCYRILYDFVSVLLIDLISRINKYTALSGLAKINPKVAVRLMSLAKTTALLGLVCQTVLDSCSPAETNLSVARLAYTDLLGKLNLPCR